MAVAVNGRIAATTRTYRGHDGETEVAAIVDPDRALRRGANRVEMFAVERDGATVELRPIEIEA